MTCARQAWEMLSGGKLHPAPEPHNWAHALFYIARIPVTRGPINSGLNRE